MKLSPYSVLHKVVDVSANNNLHTNKAAQCLRVSIFSPTTIEKLKAGLTKESSCNVITHVLGLSVDRMKHLGQGNWKCVVHAQNFPTMWTFCLGWQHCGIRWLKLYSLCGPYKEDAHVTID